jgi:predicted alpha/beta superfamily hydrolase
MKTIFNILGFLLMSTVAYGQTESSYEEKKTNYTVIKLDSKYFPDEKRIIKISIPQNYDKTKKYPIIYTLDGYSLFEMVASYAHILGNQTIEEDGYDYGTNVIPPVIVVGIFHNDRGLETEPNFDNLEYLEKPKSLKNFLVSEVIPYINGNYKTSGYNSIIGHSNTAYFTTNLLFQKDNPFQSIVALSVTEGSTAFYKKLTETLNSKVDGSFFLGYGLKDNEFNWIAKKIETNVSNNNVLVKKYNSNHSDLPASSLLDAIKYLFNDYRNFNDFNTLSANTDFNIDEYLDSYEVKIKTKYGINIQILEDDYASLLVETINNKHINSFNMLVEYYERKNNFEYPPIMLFHYRKDLGDSLEAKNIAYQILESNDENVYKFLVNKQINSFTDFFVENLNSPKEAIDFLKKGMKKYPEHKLEFSYFIAKTSIENNYELSKGKSNLRFCVKNYKKNWYFTELDLDILK